MTLPAAMTHAPDDVQQRRRDAGDRGGRQTERDDSGRVVETSCEAQRRARRPMREIGEPGTAESGSATV